MSYPTFTTPYAPLASKEDLSGLTVAELEERLAHVEASRAEEQASVEAELTQTREVLTPQLKTARELAKHLETELSKFDLSHFEHGINPRAVDAFGGLRSLRDGLRGAKLLAEQLEKEIARQPLLPNGPIYRDQTRDLRHEIQRRAEQKAARLAALREELAALGVT